MKTFILVFFLLISSKAYSLNQEMIKNKEDIEVLKIILENTAPKIPVKETVDSKYKKVLVGTEKLGFEEKKVQDSSIEFIPITYKEEVVVKSLDGDILVKKKYENKIPRYFYNKHLSKEEKNFSQRYMFISSIEEDSGFSFLYILVFNKIGEPIWFYVPKTTMFDKANYISPKIKDGFIYLILKGKESTFQKIDWFGNVLFQIKDYNFAPKRKFHHDFIFKNENKVLMLTQHKGYVRRVFWKKPEVIVYDELIQYDLEKNKYQVVWKSLDSFAPVGKNYKNDLTHSNSLDLAPDGGVLISVRNQSTLVKLNSDYTFDWSLGKNGTIKPASASDIFGMEHHAHFLEEKTILLFDNHRGIREGSFSRGVVLTFDEKKKTYKIIRKLSPKENTFAKNRSSFDKLDNGNFLAMFIITGKAFDSIIEFDGETGEEVERFNVSHFSKDSAAFRVYHFNQIDIKREAKK